MSTYLPSDADAALFGNRFAISEVPSTTFPDTGMSAVDAMRLVAASTVARSMAFSSSRTFPGQRYRSSCCAAAGVSPRILLPVRAAVAARNILASGRMSSRRSLSGGTRISTTRRRK